ncbi:glycosyltransferase [Tundrisphaera lichenicola]|uniref:glycosyltransferase n=1 Tax=Tundrisphaera lichenicola TaxID=2029860 RepID=UPI003EB9688D
MAAPRLEGPAGGGPMIGILIPGGLVALAWTALAIRLIRSSRGEWFRFLRPIEGPIPDGPEIAAIVPARNEEANIAQTIESLRAQEYPSLTITVVDDQSTDQTWPILERIANESDNRAALRVVRGLERPAGWVGKTWAVHQGVSKTRAEWLWFVDADMGLHPRALASAIREADRTGADLVSLLPGVRCETFWQGTIAASFLQLLAQLYPIDRVNDPDRPDALAAGGFILVRSSAYERAGGHEACRGEIIEDLKLAQHVKKAGGKLAVRLAPGLAWTHMYGSFGEIWRGLRKNAYAGMDYMPHKYVTGAILALLMAWAPAACLATGSSPAIVIGACGIAAQVLASVPILVFLDLPWIFALALPAGITAYVAIASASVWHHHRGRILWKDRVLSTSDVLSRSARIDESAP